MLVPGNEAEPLIGVDVLGIRESANGVDELTVGVAGPFSTIELGSIIGASISTSGNVGMFPGDNES